MRRTLAIGATITLLALSVFGAATIPSAHAMGASPTNCPLQPTYQSTITGFIITYATPDGPESFNALHYPESTLTIPNGSTYNVTMTLFTAPLSEAGNTANGSVWYDTDAPGYSNGLCALGATPSSDVTVNLTIVKAGNLNPNGDSEQGVSWTSDSPNSGPISPVGYTVDWVEGGTVSSVSTNSTGLTTSTTTLTTTTTANSATTSTSVSSSSTTRSSTTSTSVTSTLSTSSSSSSSTSTTKSSITSSTNSGTSQLTITAEDMGGNTLPGYYAVLNSSGGVIVATGITPATFSLDDGQTYTIQVDNFGDCHFNHWLDTGSTQFWRYVTLEGNAQYSAVIECASQGGGSTTSQSTSASSIVTTESAATSASTTAAPEFPSGLVAAVAVVALGATAYLMRRGNINAINSRAKY